MIIVRVTTMMERITITLPKSLLEKIDQGRGGSDQKRSAFVVEALKEYFRYKDDKTRVKGELLEAFKSPEGKALLKEIKQERERRGRPPGPRPEEREKGLEEIRRIREGLERERAGGPGEGEAPARTRTVTGRATRLRGDSIPITDEMKSLMGRYLENPSHPTRREFKALYGIDIGDMPRWLSGEKTGMRKATWEILKPVLEEFAQ